MVPIWSVLLLALFWGLCAALVGWGRKLTRRQALRDWMFASYPVAFATAAALFFFLMAARPEASVAWQNLAVACLLSAPPAAGLALWLTGRGSLIGAAVASSLALVAVVVWLTGYLKGIRGGWTLAEVATVALGAGVSLASSACAGGWLLRRRRRASSA